MNRIYQCRPKHHQFSFSLQTDGYGIKLSFIKFLEVPKKHRTRLNLGNVQRN